MQNKKLNLLLSLIIAVIMWTYVVVEENPNVTETVNNIEVEYLHTEVLSERGLALSSASVKTVNVQVSGARADIRALKQGDVRASVDLAEAGKGESELSLIVTAPKGIEIRKKSVDKVKVNVEDLVSRTIDVQVGYTGTFEENTEGLTLSVSSDQVQVSGAESLVQTVAYAKASIDASRLTENEAGFSCTLQPVNADGMQIGGLLLSQDTVTVKAILSGTKEVSLHVPVIDTSSDGADRSTKAPDKVRIKGRKDVLNGISSVTADNVDISNITESTELSLLFSSLPEGIQIADSNEPLVLQLTVSNTATRVFSYTTKDIRITGEKDGLAYTLPDGFSCTVTVKDDAKTLQKLKKEDFQIVADVSGLDDTAKEVTLTVKTDVQVETVSLSPEKASLTIQKN